jgi:hypothetical protein
LSTSRQLDDATYERNFADISPRLTGTAALAGLTLPLLLRRALHRACPTAIDIPSFIKKIARGNLKARPAPL